MGRLSTNSPPYQDKILVVDDAPENLVLIETILEEEGHEIVLANDGLKALQSIEESPPQLILLDVMMPRMDGFEVTRRIREKSNLPFIPILLISAYDYASAVQGLDSGADDFIRKPVEIDELLARVRSLLRLKHSVDEREQMMRMQEDFVSRLTHDLRTPLVAADRLLTLLQQGALGELSPAVLEAMSTMSRSNRNLLQMVNTLLEVYRYEADRKILNWSAIDLENVVGEVLQALTPLAQEKGLSLEVWREQKEKNESSFTVKGDRLELHRLLTNLIGNAIQFTERGSVSVGLEILPNREPPPLSWVVLTVRDTGTGISSEQQKWLFDRFRSGNHLHSGSGLGLHLSRQIVEIHGGTIEVQSELGKGSLFIVRLPGIN